jgi:hypothetical protein
MTVKEQSRFPEREDTSSVADSVKIDHDDDDDDDDDDDEESRDTESDMGRSPSGEEAHQQIAHAETSAVFFIRLVVTAILILSTFCVAVAVHYYTTEAEQSNFHWQYKQGAEKILFAMGTNLDVIALGVNGFAFAFSQMPQMLNAPWPLISMPAFALHAANIRRLTDATILTLYPLVLPKQRAMWEEYATNHSSWIDESLFVQQADFSQVNLNMSAAVSIHDAQGNPVKREGPFMPSWSSYPVRTQGIPYNSMLGLMIHMPSIIENSSWKSVLF